MHSKIILPRSFTDTEDKPDAAFVARMRAIDKYLFAYWNRFRGRWVIDRYTCETDHTHHNGCPRVNVRLVQTNEGTYHPLNDRVLDWLREADMWNRGMTPGSVNAELDAKKAAYDRSVDNDIRLYSRDAIHDEHIHQESNLTPN